MPLDHFSHGAGGSKDGYVLLRRLTSCWAEHGYVTIQPTHADSLALRDTKNMTQTQRLAAIAAMTEVDDPAAWEARVRDLTLIMDSLDEIARQAPGLAVRMDRERIGVGGHSFGAATTAMIGGAAKSLADPRPQALLLISGQGRGRFGFTEHSWDEFKRPMMSITGSRDLGYKNQSPDWRREPYRYSPPGDKYDVFIEGASHMTFAGQGPAVAFEYAKIASLAFWDAYLKHSEAAKKWLLGEPAIGHK